MLKLPCLAVSLGFDIYKTHVCISIYRPNCWLDSEVYCLKKIVDNTVWFNIKNKDTKQTLFRVTWHNTRQQQLLDLWRCKYNVMLRLAQTSACTFHLSLWCRRCNTPRPETGLCQSLAMFLCFQSFETWRLRLRRVILLQHNQRLEKGLCASCFFLNNTFLHYDFSTSNG